MSVRFSPTPVAVKNAINKILLDVDDGVMETEKPVMSVNVPLAVVNESSFVVCATCNTAPLVDAVTSANGFQPEPLYVNNWSVSVS